MANMVVRTNIFALNAHRNMKNVGAEQQRASNRLASGFRINSAADDAAGLAISESMRAQIRGLDQASRNAQDGQALINTAEGGMQEIQNMLQRIRELTVQAANDTNTDLNRMQILAEVNQLMDEIDDMANRVEFNGMTLLNGELSVRLQSAIDNLDNNIGMLAEFIANQQVGDGAMTNAGAATGTWVVINEAWLVSLALAAGVDTIAFTTATAQADWLARHIGATDSASVIADLAAADIDDLDSALVARGLLGRLRTVAGSELNFQVGANSNQLMNVGIGDIRLRTDAGTATGGLGLAMSSWLAGYQSAFIGSSAIEISNMIQFIDEGLNFISDERAALGAVSNRLDFTSRSLDISSENLSDAESRVRNTDMAREMMRFTMSNVLQQAAVSMLAQASQLPNNLLQLLR